MELYTHTHTHTRFLPEVVSTFTFRPQPGLRSPWASGREGRKRGASPSRATHEHSASFPSPQPLQHWPCPPWFPHPELLPLIPAHTQSLSRSPDPVTPRTFLGSLSSPPSALSLPLHLLLLLGQLRFCKLIWPSQPGSHFP